MPIFEPPCQNAAYLFLCRQALEANLDEAFRRLCMLLNAPSDMRCLLLVVNRVHRMLSAVPAEWILDEDFAGVREVAEWAVENASMLKRQLGDAIDPHWNTGRSHPMYGFLTRHPLYSMMCNTQQVASHEDEFLLLQLHVLTARARELRRQQSYNYLSYIDLYESNASDEDFAAHLRQPHHAALAVRELSEENAAPLVRFLQTWRAPDSFATLLAEREGRPVGRAFGYRVRHICHYCALKSYARASYVRQSGERLSASASRCFGYIEYGDFRSGVDCAHGDPDEEFLDCPEHELLTIRTTKAEELLLGDDEPSESAMAELLLVSPSVPKNAFLQLDVDKECMPWSAIYLRPEEIEHTLLQALQAHADGTIATEPEQLEICALIAVCMETGRPLEHATALRYSEDPRGDFSLLPGESAGRRLRWAWKGIQPLYKTHPPYVEGKEVRRCDYIVNVVHGVTDALLRKWMRVREEPSALLFPAPCSAYKTRIKEWLHTLDSSGRLAIEKIARVQWSLLFQLTGGDSAEVSLTLGLPHPRSRVSLFYALLSVADAHRLFAAATTRLWGGAA